MNDYKITFGLNGIAKQLMFSGESEGEAIEQFDLFCEQFDEADIEFVSIKEI